MACGRAGQSHHTGLTLTREQDTSDGEEEEREACHRPISCFCSLPQDLCVPLAYKQTVDGFGVCLPLYRACPKHQFSGVSCWNKYLKRLQAAWPAGGYRAPLADGWREPLKTFIQIKLLRRALQDCSNGSVVVFKGGCHIAHLPT